MKKRAVERREEATEFSDEDDYNEDEGRRSKEGARGKKGYGMTLYFIIVGIS